MIQPKYTNGNITYLDSGYNRIGIIGARNSSTLERRKAYFESMRIYSEGHIVVSGLAHGIDTFAHMGSIHRTIAVVHNINDIYPKENRKLAEEIIINNGLIISPYNIDRGKTAFLDRDRMLVDICDEIMVIGYYDYSSGTAYTVNYAEQKGVKVTEIKV